MVWAVGDASPYNSFFERIIKKESAEKNLRSKKQKSAKRGKVKEGECRGEN